MKLSTGLENFKGVVSDDLSFVSVEIDKNYWFTLPWWRNLCHRLSSATRVFQRPREAEKRDPGNEVASIIRLQKHNGNEQQRKSPDADLLNMTETSLDISVPNT